MQPKPQPGEAWFADFGLAEKPRWTLIIGCHANGRLAVASALLITTQFAGTPYEVTLPRVPWLREQSYVNAQSIQPVKLTELLRKATGQFQASVLDEVRKALSRWLAMQLTPA
jgi:mRNA interferase MazF